MTPTENTNIPGTTDATQDSSEKHADILNLLMWPFAHLRKTFASARRSWKESGDSRILEEVCKDIYITDTMIDGRVVIALKVHGVVVDYIRHHEDKDPEGYLLHDGASQLIERMQHIRMNEYTRKKANI